MVNDQDFPKLTGGGTRQRGGDWTTSNTVVISYFPKDLTSSWGDELIQLTLNEQWDDGNSKSFDGCSSSCTIETGFRCTEIASLNYRSYWSKDWGNGAIENGEIWDDGNYFSGDGWDSNWQEEVGFKWDNSFGLASSWIPYWGNGVKDASYFEKWDDGNNFNYDGCDAKWKIEDNFSCIVNSGGKDVWTTKYATPVVKSTTLDISLFQILVEFDQVMKYLSDINIMIDGPNSPYSVSWSCTYDKTIQTISFSSSPSLIGVDEYITLQLLRVENFQSEYSIPISNSQQFIFTVPRLSSSQVANIGGSTASYMFLFTILLSIAVSVITGDSIELMWSMTNTLQLMFYLSYLDLYYSSDLLRIFSYMKYSNFDNEGFEYIRSHWNSMLSFDTYAVPSSLSNLGYSSSSILINFFEKIIGIIFLLIVSIVLIWLSRWLAKKSNKFANFIRK